MQSRKTKDYKIFSVDVWQQWFQFFNPKRYNWIDFYFINLYVDVDRNLGHAEIELAILGVGIRIYWIYNSKRYEKKMKKYDKDIKEMKENE